MSGPDGPTPPAIPEPPPAASVRIAAVGDLHCGKTSKGQLSFLSDVNGRADVLVLCGDLTDYGTPEEAEVLAAELAVVGVPIVGVLGNHDFESGRQAEVTKILCEAGVTILDGEVHSVRGVSFAGAKGYCGGFGRHTLEPWGEPGIKAFVQEAMDETMKLEKALARLRGGPRVVILHYAPCAATVAGEPPEIFPFLGSSRLEEPLNRYGVEVVFHGHAHRGSPCGKTMAGVPVYNVALPLMRRTMQDAPPFRIVELPLTMPAAPPSAEPRRRRDDQPV